MAYYANKVINAHNGVFVGDFVFSTVDDKHTLAAYFGDATDITLPDNYNGENYAIGDNVFKNNSSITSITIPNSVTSIGSDAFRGCSGLTSIEIPNNVTSIGNYAFYDCSGLTSITIPNSVTSIGSSAFEGCDGLTSIIVEPGNPKYDSRENSNAIVETESNTLITGCKNTVIPYSITSIGDGAFRGCKGLTSITIPNSVISIGESAFYGCDGLTSIEIPNSVTSIGESAFYGCDGLTSIEIPNSVTSIGNNAFYSCDALTSITIPNSVTSIGNNAFYSCDALTSITIPNSVTSIGNKAFYDCSNLKTVINLSNLTFSQGSYDYGYVAYYTDKVINDPKATFVGDFVFSTVDDKHTLVAYLGKATEITLPDNYNGENYVIGIDAFEGCSWLTNITIPNSVTSIGQQAFSGCKGLTSITIPNSVTSIGQQAFSGCKGLTSITIPNSVTSIGNYAFEDCEGLTSVTIGNSVTSIGNDAFRYCYNLKTVINLSNLTFSQGSYDYGYVAYYANKVINAHNGVFVGDFVFSTVDDKHTLAAYFGDATDITLPDNYNGENYAIGDNVFKNNSSITSITIPNSVTSIGDMALFGCSGLTSITIPNSVTSIGYDAFVGCSGLKTVINLSNLTFTKGSTNYGCVAYYADKVINAPNGAVIGDYVFSKPNDQYILTQYLGNDTKIVLPENCNGENYAIGANVFKDNTTITSITIPNSVTSIGDAAFEGCTGLTSITIPNSVTSIGGYAFYDCSGLTNVTIGKGVINMGGGVFDGCPSITTITLLGEIPPGIINTDDDYEYDFTPQQYETVVLYVPEGSLDVYKSAYVWKEFFNIKEFDNTGIENLEAGSFNGLSDVYYDLNGCIVDNPTKGIYIINGKKVLVK